VIQARVRRGPGRAGRAWRWARTLRLTQGGRPPAPGSRSRRGLDSFYPGGSRPAGWSAVAVGDDDLARGAALNDWGDRPPTAATSHSPASPAVRRIASKR
jgi:hypothetical protein